MCFDFAGGLIQSFFNFYLITVSRAMALFVSILFPLYLVLKPRETMLDAVFKLRYRGRFYLDSPRRGIPRYFEAKKS